MKKIFLISSIVFGGFLFAQNSEAKISVKQVEKKFKYKKYSPEILKNFVNEIDENDTTLFESIPGEIIGWTSTDKGNQTQTETFQIKNGTIKEINTTIGEIDLKKLDKYAPKNSHFELNDGLYDAFKYQTVGEIEKKLKNNEFLINAQITLSQNGTDDKLYEIEYQTKDFKKFVLKRLKPMDTKKWINIK